MAGGDGDDVYVVDNSGDIVDESESTGIDTVQSYLTIDLAARPMVPTPRIIGAVENLVLLGEAGINGYGNELANIIVGNGGDNILQGNAGNDLLRGGDGNDLLNGDSGDDTMSGGSGDDTYIVDSAGDVVDDMLEAGAPIDSGGFDSVESSVDFNLSDSTHVRGSIEVLTLTGTGNLKGTGNAQDNTLYGNDSANEIDGAAGADWMIGGGGDDTYTVDNPGDRVIESDNGGTDIVKSSIGYTLTGNLEQPRHALSGRAVRSVVVPQERQRSCHRHHGQPGCERRQSDQCRDDPESLRRHAVSGGADRLE